MLLGPNKLITDFFDAARTGNIDELERLIHTPEIVENINAGVENINVGDARYHNYTNVALRYAITNGHVNVVMRLLRVPAVIVTENIVRDVVEKGSIEIFNHFLTIPQINFIIRRWSPFYIQMVARLGLLDFLNSLLALEGIQEELIANVERPGLTRRIFIDAAQNGHFEIVTRLLQIPNFLQAIDTDPETRLYAAIVNGDLDAIAVAVRFLANQRAIEPYQSGICLEIAAAMGHLPIVEHLLKWPLVLAGLRNGRNGLLGAIKKGHINVVAHLLKVPEIRSYETETVRYFPSAVEAAISYGQHEILELLLTIRELADSVFPPDSYSTNDPLDRVAENGDLKVAQVLLKMPRVIARLGTTENYELMALDRGHLEVVNRFLEISDEEMLEVWRGLSMSNKIMYRYQQRLSPASRTSCSPLTRLGKCDIDFQLRVLRYVLDHISVQCPLIAQIDSLGNITNEYAREYPVYAAKLVGKLFNLIQASGINLEEDLTPNQASGINLEEDLTPNQSSGINLEEDLTPNQYAILLDLHPVRRTSMFTRLMEVASPEPALVEPGAPTSIFNFSRLSSTLRRWCPCRSGEQLELEQDDLRAARNRL